MIRPLLLALVSLGAVSAQAQSERTAYPQIPCVLHAGGHLQDAAPSAEEMQAQTERWIAATSPTSETVVTAGGGATFVVTYTGFEPYPDAQAAYQAAVDIWANHLSSPVPIRVTASFEPLGTGVLGSAGPFLTRNFSGTPRSNTWYPFALADAIVGADLSPGNPDIQSRFSSNFSNWYFGTDGQTPANQYDFRSVVLHELGHGLGFSGSGRWDDGTSAGRCGGLANQGCWGYFNGAATGAPMVFDTFAEDATGVPLLDVTAFPNPSVALGTLVRSSNVWIDTPRVLAANGGTRGRLWTPTTWQQGSSYSHWNEGVYAAGTPNALMTPQIGTAEAYNSPGPITCAFFADMGWPLGPGCASFVADEATPTAAAALRVAGPNPTAGQTAVALSLDTPGTVRADLFDALGRRVRVLHDGPASGTLTLAVDATGLPAGLYTVRATTPAGTSSVRIAVAR